MVYFPELGADYNIVFLLLVFAVGIFVFVGAIIWRKKIERLLNKYFYIFFHVLTFVTLTIYVIKNWNSCISMQFFSQFNGNNILFLVWIILILLLIYEVEGKGIKVAQRKHDETQRSLSEVQLAYRKNQVDALLEQMENGDPNDSTHLKEEGGH